MTVQELTLCFRPSPNFLKVIQIYYPQSVSALIIISLVCGKEWGIVRELTQFNA